MSDGDFEGYGGRHVPEPLREPLEQLANAYDDIKETADFQSELRGYLEEFAGRPTPLYHARNLSERYGADTYLKREDRLHGGEHKLNNTLGQAILTKRAGKTRLIAEIGSGPFPRLPSLAWAAVRTPSSCFTRSATTSRFTPFSRVLSITPPSAEALHDVFYAPCFTHNVWVLVQ